jgi:hypothetical protein
MWILLSSWWSRQTAPFTFHGKPVLLITCGRCLCYTYQRIPFLISELVHGRYNRQASLWEPWQQCATTQLFTEAERTTTVITAAVHIPKRNMFVLQQEHITTGLSPTDQPFQTCDIVMRRVDCSLPASGKLRYVCPNLFGFILPNSIGCRLGVCSWCLNALECVASRGMIALWSRHQDLCRAMPHR